MHAERIADAHIAGRCFARADAQAQTLTIDDDRQRRRLAERLQLRHDAFDDVARRRVVGRRDGDGVGGNEGGDARAGCAAVHCRNVKLAIAPADAIAGQHGHLEQVGMPHEPRHERTFRAQAHVVGRPDLQRRAGVQHADAIGKAQRLLQIVGDEQHRDVERAMQRRDLLLQRLARHAVDGGERFVQQENLRIAGERTRQRDALALAARELIGLARLEAGKMYAGEQLRGIFAAREALRRRSMARRTLSRAERCGNSA